MHSIHSVQSPAESPIIRRFDAMTKKLRGLLIRPKGTAIPTIHISTTHAIA